MKEKLLIISGPTGVGKSSVSLELAKKLKNAEIISSDSMQIYKGMDIGTAKIKKEEMNGIKHHMIDIVDVDKHYSVYDYKNDVEFLIKKINENNCIPLIIGGTGLYINSIINELNFSQIEEDQTLRAELKKELEKFGSDFIYNKLKECDNEYAQIIHKNDTFRIIRALEVFYKSGKKYSDINKNFKTTNDNYDLIYIVLDMPREELYRRINLRVDTMLKEGLIEEVRTLMKKYPDYEELRPSKAIGYKEVISFLKSEISFQEMVEKIKQNSRNYAKRQLTWFRADKRVEYLDIYKKNMDDIINTINNKIENRWYND